MAMLLPEGKLLIDGELRAAEGGKTFEDISPWTGEVVGIAPDASEADVEAAIASSRKAFDTTDWATNHEKRYELVKKFHALLIENKDTIIKIIHNEAGAGLGAMHTAHYQWSVGCGEELIKAFPDLTWEEDLGSNEVMGIKSDRIMVREAIGVAAAITPWNVPLYISVGKLYSAWLAGCTVILKPAPDTPLSATYLGELAVQAGFPPGVLNVLTGKDPAMIGEMLTADPRVDLITFTGSTGVGKRIMERGAATLKRVFLELGGKSAKIVLEDAPDFAREVASSMLIYHAGQGCAVMSRLLVPKSRYAEACKILEMAYGAFADKWGNKDDPANMMGPLISAKQKERVLGYIELGQKEGARLLVGGKAREDKGNGYFVEPTCFVDVSNDMRIAQEEIFGPVLVVIPFEDEEDAIRIANESQYGLAGSVSTADPDKAMKIARRIRAGNIAVNGGLCIWGDLPFGGYKASGIGREWGLEGIEEYLETKSIAIGVK